MSATLGQVARAHPAHSKADSMMLVTHGGQEEQPGGLRGTDGLVRRRRVWREQELWFWTKERQGAEVLSVFTGKLLPCCGVVSKLKRQPYSPTPLFCAIKSTAGLGGDGSDCSYVHRELRQIHNFCFFLAVGTCNW